MMFVCFHSCSILFLLFAMCEQDIILIEQPIARTESQTASQTDSQTIWSIRKQNRELLVHIMLKSY